jgi:hypothetical protein
VQTLSEDYLLTIEIYARAGGDKQAALDSLEKMVIEDSCGRGLPLSTALPQKA